MSLYREARSGHRRLWIVASIAALAVVTAALLVLARADGTPSSAEKLQSLQDDVQPALAALELIPIHYASPNPTTHAAAADQLGVARATVVSVESDLRTLDATGTARVLAELDELARLVPTTGHASRVERLATKTTSDLRALVRLD